MERLLWTLLMVLPSSVGLLTANPDTETVVHEGNFTGDCKGYFWHVTDFHYDFSYWNEKLSCNNNVTNPGTYGDYWCDSPWRLVTDSIEAMKKIKPDVDFLLWTGDTVAHISEDRLNTTINMDMLVNVTNALSHLFPNKTVYATFGNHDYYRKNQFPDVTNYIYNRTAEIWKDWIGDDQMSNFRKGGYYTKMINTHLRIVCLNTNLYYTSNKQSVNKSDPTEQFTWFQEILKQARTSVHKVFVTAHIPPGVHTPRAVVWYYPKFNEQLVAIIRDFADVIVGMHFGHDHHDGFKIFSDMQGKVAVPLFVAPSVTPWRYKLPDGSIGPSHNPSVRLVTYDRDTGGHIDIEQYYLDLPTDNRLASDKRSANFTLLYKFTQQYNIFDIAAPSLDGLVKRMMRQDAEGDRLIEDYHRLATTGALQDQVQEATCDSVCTDRIRCGLAHHLQAEFDSCMQNLVNSSSLNITNIFVIIIVGVISVLLVVLYR